MRRVDLPAPRYPANSVSEASFYFGIIAMPRLLVFVGRLQRHDVYAAAPKAVCLEARPAFNAYNTKSDDGEVH